jgi:hypothetical protein
MNMKAINIAITCITVVITCFSNQMKGQDYQGPRIVDPANTVSSPPSDAIVLFDGKDLSQWESVNGGDAKWTLENDAMTVAPGSGGIRTLRSFGDIQFHIEWRIPADISGEGQNRGNSGIFFQQVYEIQILDCYQNQNPTYVEGTAGSIYTQSAPLVNACRKAGEWQTYDVVYIAPRFKSDGTLETPARITLFHNGVLIQNNFELKGTTYNQSGYTAHDKLPLELQDHWSAVSFRNIWLREL